MKQSENKIQFFLLTALLVFLPFSSWLVSLTGRPSISLIRDLIIGLLFLLAIPRLFKVKKNAVLIIASCFMFYVLLSFFWREASAEQWLKGVRFTVMPIVLFLSLWQLEFSETQKTKLHKIILSVAIFISILGVLEFFGIKIPLVTSLSGAGALDAVHKVGESILSRIQAVLAGPNALGLYMLAIIAFVVALPRHPSLQARELGSRKLFSFFDHWIPDPVRPCSGSECNRRQVGNDNRKYWLLLFVPILLLTFSRSAAIGLAVIALLATISFLIPQMGKFKTWLVVLCAIIILGLGGVVLYKTPRFQNIITHSSSSSLRLEQYRRIWNEKSEIGLLGRGSGTAGPSSQTRLDGGVNHWTENIYLDIFEELGLVGLCIYLALIVSVIMGAWRVRKTPEGHSAFLALSGFAVTGIFINYYTGQVGLYLVWLIAALALNNREKHETNSN